MRTISWLIPLAFAAFATPALAAPPANGVGEVLFKAREADGMKRVSGTSYFEGGKGAKLVFMEFRAGKASFTTEFLRLKNDNVYEADRMTMGFGGLISKASYATGTGMNEPKPEDITKGVVEGEKITFTRDGKPAGEAELKGAVVNMATAFLVLPAYYEFLPAELSFSLIMQKHVIPGFKLIKGEEKDGKIVVKLKGPEGMNAELTVSTAAATKGQVLLVSVDGDDCKRITDKQAHALMKAAKAPKGAASFANPKAAVESLIAAAKSGDMKAVGACFSANAAGEFKTLIDGTCPPDKFKQFCQMFSGASVKGVEQSVKEPNKARVEVSLGSRGETLTVVKEAAGWRVLDF